MIKFILIAALLLVPYLGMKCAQGSQALGRYTTLGYLIDTMSVAGSIGRLIKASAKAVILAILIVAPLLALVLFAPSGSETWAPLVGSLLGFLANLILGAAAGIALLVAGILARPATRDTIDADLDMIQRTRRRLWPFLSFLMAVLLLAGGTCQAAGTGHVWVWAIDGTDSLDPAQRQLGIEALVGKALATARAMNVDTIQVVRFTDEELLSDMTWVEVPRAFALADCRRAKPEGRIPSGLMGLSPTWASDRKQAGLAKCSALQAHRRAATEERESAFITQLRLATRLTPRADRRTRILPLLSKLIQRPHVRSIALLSDGVDTTGQSISSLHVPDHMSVTLVLTRPNPRRSTPTLADVLAEADVWARVRGIRVTTATEYAGLHDGRAGR